MSVLHALLANDFLVKLFCVPIGIIAIMRIICCLYFGMYLIISFFLVLYLVASHYYKVSYLLYFKASFQPYLYPFCLYI